MITQWVIRRDNMDLEIEIDYDYDPPSNIQGIITPGVCRIDNVSVLSVTGYDRYRNIAYRRFNLGGWADWVDDWAYKIYEMRE